MVATLAGMKPSGDNFLRSELEGVRGPGGLTIELDLYFKSGLTTEIISRYSK